MGKTVKPEMDTGIVQCLPSLELDKEPSSATKKCLRFCPRFIATMITAHLVPVYGISDVEFSLA